MSCRPIIINCCKDDCCSGTETGGNGGGITNHAALENLEYSNSGHTGFASAKDLEDLKNKIEKLTGDTIIPAGLTAFFAADIPPIGWLKADGAAVNRTTYADLFAAIGTIYGAGDGESTFNLPDLRGEFLRGFDDGRGVDNGRVFGSAQGDAIRNITGQFGFESEVDGLTGTPNITGPFYKVKDATRKHVGGTVAGTNKLICLDVSLVVPTADENRPRNIALLACIKY